MSASANRSHSAICSPETSSPKRAASSASAANGGDARRIVGIVAAPSARGIRVLAAVALLLLGGASYADATGAVSTVAIQSFAFDPGTVTVAVGDTVTWVDRDAVAHTSTATSGAWSSGTLGPGAMFSFSFRAPGTFTYRCAFHPSMTGTVIVQSAATPVPTRIATPVPTPVPTLVPTPVPTPLPTAAVVTTPDPAPTTAAPATSVPRSTAAAPPASPGARTTSTAQPAADAGADATASRSEGGVPAWVLLGGAAAALLALVGGALVLLRR